MVLNANAAIRSAVAEDVGPAVLSVITVRDDLADGRVVEVAVKGADMRRQLRAVWPKGSPVTGAVKHLLQIAARIPVQGSGR
jgi:DNA-binding transcriptional LysR family regulator